MVSNFPNRSISTSILHTQTSPGKLSESLLVQTPRLCLQDLLPTSAYLDILNAHLQASCRSLHCPNTSLASPGLTPNLSLSRYPKHFKTCHLWQSLDKSLSTNDLTVNMPHKWNKNTSHLNREYSSSSMPLTLHKQHTNLVITSEP